jgi:hypothetical protein
MITPLPLPVGRTWENSGEQRWEAKAEDDPKKFRHGDQSPGLDHAGCRLRCVLKQRESIRDTVVRALKRRLGKGASPEGLIASFRTRVVAEPAL